MQLIEPGLDLYDTMNDRKLGREHVLEKFGVEPDKLGEVLALMGDSSDNIPGVPSTGSSCCAARSTIITAISA
jgi:DNA polymerase-1